MQNSPCSLSILLSCKHPRCGKTPGTWASFLKGSFLFQTPGVLQDEKAHFTAAPTVAVTEDDRQETSHLFRTLKSNLHLAILLTLQIPSEASHPVGAVPWICCVQWMILSGKSWWELAGAELKVYCSRAVWSQWTGNKEGVSHWWKANHELERLAAGKSEKEQIRWETMSRYW